MRRQAEGGVGGRGADERGADAARIDGQEHAGEDLALAHHHAAQRDAVGAGAQFQVVAHVHGRRQETDLLGEFFAHALDAREQVALAALVDHGDQAVAQFQAQQVDRLQVVPGGFAVVGGGGLVRHRCGFAFFLETPPGDAAEDEREAQEHRVRHAGHDAEHEQHGGGDAHDFAGQEHLADDLAAQVGVLAHARNHHGRGDRDQQRWNLRHQRVTNGQQDVAVGGFTGAQAVLHHADDQAADDVDEQDDDAGDGVAAHELGSTIHGAEELGLFAHFEAAALGFLFVDQARAQVGVDRHLLAGHGIQGEARRDLGDALRALGDHHEVDHDQDREDDETDRKVATDQEVAEGFDHGTGRARAGVAFEQHDAGGRHVERQAQQRGEQQHRGKDREVERSAHVGRDHHHHQRERDVEREEGVEQPGRQRQHHHGQHGDDQQRRGQAVGPVRVAAEPAPQDLQLCVHGVVSVAGFFQWGSSSGGTCGTGISPGMTPWPLRAALSWYT
ncbi:hypothetical protein FQZ97_705580 [compost metagenome]